MIFTIQSGKPGNLANKNDSNGNAVAVTDFGEGFNTDKNYKQFYKLLKLVA